MRYELNLLLARRMPGFVLTRI